MVRLHPWAPRANFTLLLTFLLAGPAVAAITVDTPLAPSDPSPIEATPAVPSSPSLAEWEAVGSQFTRDHEMPVGLPSDDPLYLSVPPEARLAAWRAWSRVASVSLTEGQSAASPWLAAQPGGSPNKEIAIPKGLRGLWSIETHGTPRAVIPVSPPGATLLLTQVAILRFDAPGAAPSWMVKVGGFPGMFGTADANGDGSLDLVLALHSWFSSDVPSPLIIDGKTGAALWTGPTGDNGLVTWVLTDLDGDKKPDLLGRTAADQLVGYSLSGTKLFAKPLPLKEDVEVDLVVERVAVRDWGWMSTRFGDFNGDGVKDAAYIATKYYEPAWMEQAVVVAASGKDASLLWIHAGVPQDGWVWWSLGPVGDMGADAKEDVVVYTMDRQYVSVDPLPAVASYYANGYAALNGADGSILFYDRASFASIYGPAPNSQVLSAYSYNPVMVLDLNKDGKTELIARRFTEKGIEFSARGPSTKAPGATKEEAPLSSTELYRVDALIGDHDLGPLRYRDLDGDGRLDILFITYSTIANNSGHTVLHTHINRIIGTQATEETTNAFLGLLDFDPDGKRYYGWVLENDLWMPMTTDGFFEGEGFRLIPSGEVLAARDVTGDGIQDLALPKSLGIVWLDGTTGGLLHDVLLPEDRFGQALLEEEGRLRALCQDLQDNYYLVDLDTAKDVWAIAPDRFGEDARIYIRDMKDATGDGLLEIAARVHAEKFSMVVFDPRKSDAVASFDEGNVGFFDGLPARAGHELLREWEDEKDGDKAGLLVPKESSVRWSVSTDNGFLRGGNGGTLLLETWSEEEQAVIVINGADGKELARFATSAREDVGQVEVVRADADAVDDVLMLVATMPTESGIHPLPFEARLWSGAKKEITSRFALTPGTVEAEISQFGTRFNWGDAPSMVGPAGDWDADGLVDFVFEENETPVVRSMAKGGILAVAPAHSDIVKSVDMDGDKREELLLKTFTGELRLMTYDAKAAGGEESPILRAIEKPLDPKVEEGASKFFEEAKKGQGTPGPGFLGVIVLLGLVAALVRSRGAR